VELIARVGPGSRPPGYGKFRNLRYRRKVLPCIEGNFEIRATIETTIRMREALACRAFPLEMKQKCTRGLR
jgi:hypothetical protein